MTSTTVTKATKKQLRYIEMLAERNTEAATPLIAATLGREPESVDLKLRGVSLYIYGELGIGQASELIDELKAI
jgi:hypothetical protein